MGGLPRRGRPGLRDNLHRQKVRLHRRHRHSCWVRRITGIAQPFEDQIRVHRVAPRHLGNRNTRRSRLQADRPLLVIRPEPPRPTRHTITIVSTIDGGHYPHLSPRGRAVRPDAYGASHRPRPSNPTSRGSMRRTPALRRSSDMGQSAAGTAFQGDWSNVDQVLTRIWNDKSRSLFSALKSLIILYFLVAGAGFEPAAFRL